MFPGLDRQSALGARDEGAGVSIPPGKYTNGGDLGLSSSLPLFVIQHYFLARFSWNTHPYP